MNERDEVLLRDMLDAARAAQRFASGKTREMLDSDEMLAGVYADTHEGKVF